MTFAILPPESRMRWRRLDISGSEDALFEQTRTGWHLAGKVEVVEAGVYTWISYQIECDSLWRTLSALVHGEAGAKSFRFEFAVDKGQWTKDGIAVPELSGAIDLDFGFTPATNTLPIRRLGLEVGDTAPVISAWLRFPELSFEALSQTYTRESEQVYRYVAQVDGAPFTARLDTDRYGRVVLYEGLWEAEVAAPM